MSNADDELEEVLTKSENLMKEFKNRPSEFYRYFRSIGHSKEDALRIGLRIIKINLTEAISRLYDLPEIREAFESKHEFLELVGKIRSENIGGARHGSP